MESKGTLKSVTKDWMTGKFLITFELEHDISSQIEGIRGKELNITAKQYKKKRSLDANAFYWSLLSKLSEALHISKTRAHSIMLRRYGQPAIVDGSVAYVPIPDTERAEETALESEAFHIKPTSQVFQGTDGVVYRTYKMLRGSSEYNTKEMSELINGLVAECRELGIDTLAPDEIRRMMELYEQSRRRKSG